MLRFPFLFRHNRPKPTTADADPALECPLRDPATTPPDDGTSELRFSDGTVSTVDSCRRSGSAQPMYPRPPMYARQPMHSSGDYHAPKPASVAWAWDEVSCSVALEGGSGGEADAEADAEAVLAHKNTIAEDLLTLHCPECGMAFFDFSACFALWCARCSCAFCAYCQTSCRAEHNDAHTHVLSCEHNIAPGKSIFASSATFERSQNLRRARAVGAYLARIGDARLRSAVLEATSRDLEALGIQV